jgi:hypothetical protein
MLACARYVHTTIEDSAYDVDVDHYLPKLCCTVQCTTATRFNSICSCMLLYTINDMPDILIQASLSIATDTCTSTEIYTVYVYAMLI